VHPDQNLFFRMDFAFDQGQVLVLVNVIQESDGFEFPIGRRQDRFRDLVNEGFGPHPIGDDIRYGNDLEAVFLRELLQVRHAAMVPSSFITSQMTPAGLSLASLARSTEPSV